MDHKVKYSDHDSLSPLAMISFNDCKECFHHVISSSLQQFIHAVALYMPLPVCGLSMTVEQV